MSDELRIPTSRHKLPQDPMEACLDMAEGNPGALAVIMRITAIEGPDGFMTILNLDDMNIRGVQLLVAFKDHCKEDLKALVECAKHRDPAMVKTVNLQSYIKEQAVAMGASYAHR